MENKGQQQNALKDAMARAKEIAAKLQQTAPTDRGGGQKRGNMDGPGVEPIKKGRVVDSVDHNDPKVIAQQLANSFVKRGNSNFGPMLVEELMIPNKLVGLVIGKGGEMINKLQSDTGAKVQVAPDPPHDISGVVQERQITITGTAEAVNKAKALIAEIQNSGKAPEHLLMGNTPGEFSLEVSIPKSKIGLIIGKGGETIKSLQEQAGCRMNLFQDGVYTNQPEKPLRISGEQGAVMFGRQLVTDLLFSKERESNNPNRRQNEGQNYVEMPVPRAAVGLIIGTGGENIQRIQAESGCRVQFKNEMEGPTKIAMLTGSPGQVAAAQGMLNEIIQTGNSGGAGGGGQRQQMNGFGEARPWNDGPGMQQGPGGSKQSAPRGFGNNSKLQPGHKDMIIEVPANRCGLVIGKGGETIKLIKSETKINIQIDRSIPEVSPFRVFRVQGTDEMIEQALVIIREKTNDPSIIAKPEGAGSESTPVPFGQTPWGAPSPAPWGQPPQENQQWNQQQQQQQWTAQQQQQQPTWAPQPQQPEQAGAWNQQSQQLQGAAGWNQLVQQQPWDPQQQQQQQQTAQWSQQSNVQQQQQQDQWAAQQQWGQPQPQGSNPAQAYQQVQSAANVVATTDPTQAQAATTAAGGQPDYSAAWALYYQQQQQYYQQYALQQQQQQQQQAGAVSTAAPSSVAATAVSSQGASSQQAQVLAQYQAQLAEFQAKYGQPQ